MEMWAHFDQSGDPVGSAAKARVTLDKWVTEAWDNFQPNGS